MHLARTRTPRRPSHESSVWIADAGDRIRRSGLTREPPGASKTIPLCRDRAHFWCRLSESQNIEFAQAAAGARRVTTAHNFVEGKRWAESLTGTWCLMKLTSTLLCKS